MFIASSYHHEEIRWLKAVQVIFTSAKPQVLTLQTGTNEYSELLPVTLQTSTPLGEFCIAWLFSDTGSK